MAPLHGFLHGLLSHSRLYKAVQAVAGGGLVHRWVKGHLAGLALERVLDVGGGTGAYASDLPPESLYICLDNDPSMLEGFHPRSARHAALKGDAAAIPLASKSVPTSLMVNVSHHLDDAALDRTLAEMARVTSGEALIADAILSPLNPVSLLLWRLDRGSFPRPEERLVEAIGRRFTVARAGRLTVLHSYRLWLCRPREG